MTIRPGPRIRGTSDARQGPVHAVADSDFYGVCAWDAVNDVVARPEDFSSNLTATMTYQGGRVGAFPMGELGGEIQALATADDPAHAAHRKLLVPQLTAKRINALESFVGETETDSGTKARRTAPSSGCRRWQSAADDGGRPADRGTRRGHRSVRAMGLRGTKVVEGLVGQDELTAAGVAVMELAGYIHRTLPAGGGRPEGQSS